MAAAEANEAPSTNAVKKKDLWEVDVLESDDKAWGEKTGVEKATTVFVQVMKICFVCWFLYSFIISLGIMGDAFKVIAGPTAGQVFRNNEIFDNPIAGLVLGILATVLVQSSSTSTSIIISMTASNLMEVKNAIPMIMGANIGTSVTNTIVSMFQIGNKDEYRRAFAGATVHDCFNFLTVVVLLPVEAATGLLREISAGIVGDQDFEKEDKIDFLKKITKPVTARIVAVDKKLVTKVAEAEDQATLDELLEQSMLKNSRTTDNNIFLDTPLSDQAAGWILLIVSLILLSTCLILLVKVLQSVFKGRAAIAMKSLLNLEFKSVPFIADYILIVAGMIITILMQSSSVTTSTLTPLVGIGLVRLEKMFCFTVGANIGTTVTGILSALASSNINIGLRVALAHLFFNLLGTAIYFPIPIVRAIPLAMAKTLGCVAADWKWFPPVYIAIAFGLVPVLLLVLSLIHWAVLLVFLALALPAFFATMVILALRKRSPERLPQWALKDPKIGQYSILPPSMMMNPPAEEDDAVVTSSNADSKNSWIFEPFVWGPTWFVICGLLLVCFNAKWADFKYHLQDSRNHFGMGAWQACGVEFESGTTWASQPTTDFAVCQAHYQSVNQYFIGNCSVSGSGFADVDGRDVEYWDMMEASTTICSVNDWLTLCLQTSCEGSKHSDQCRNVSEDVTREYTWSYPAAGVPWTAGDKCREPSLLCDSDGGVATAGNLAVVAFVFCAIGQLAIFFRAAVGKARQQVALMGIFGILLLGWILLVASAASMGATLNGDAECVLAVPGNHGFARAKGTFGDMVNAGGSYAYYVVIASCIVQAVVLLVLGQKLVADRSQAGGKSEA
ncbi:sodium-dependent phosphate transporter [Amphidinium carterae]